MLSETYHHLRQGQLSERSTKPPSCEVRVPAGGSNVDIKLTAIFSKLKAFHEIVEIALEHVFDIPEKAKTISPQTHVMLSIVIEESFINKNLSRFFTYPIYQQNLQPLTPPPFFLCKPFLPELSPSVAPGTCGGNDFRPRCVAGDVSFPRSFTADVTRFGLDVGQSELQT